MHFEDISSIIRRKRFGRIGERKRILLNLIIGTARLEIPLEVLRKTGIQGYSTNIKTFVRRCLKF
jgi:hypothetical protein